MRAKAGVTIVSCGALSLALCAGQVVRAQAAPSTPTSAGATFEDSTNELSVAVGKAVLVDCAQPIQRVAVGLGEIAEATAVSPTEVMVDGKAPGRNEPDHLGHSRRTPVLQRHGAADSRDIEREPRRSAAGAEDGVAGPSDQGELQQQQHLSARHSERPDQFDAGGGNCVDGGKGREPAGRERAEVEIRRSC